MIWTLSASKKRERHLEVEAGLGLDVHDLAEAQHDRLLALVDDEDRRIDEEQDDGRDDGDEWETVGHHWFPPVAGAGALFCSSGSGR